MFQVSQTGQSVYTATGPQQLLNDNQPLSKLDTTQDVSFQTLSILFNHEPPQPSSGTGYSQTLIYQFKHPYTYTPAIWMTWQNTSPAYPAAPGTGGNATTFFDFGDDTAAANVPGVGGTTGLALYARSQYNSDPTYGTNGTTGFYFAKADTQNVYIYFEKNGFITPYAPLYVIGTTANMRVYVFAEPATTSTY